jgi:hypothetical protein
LFFRPLSFALSCHSKIMLLNKVFHLFLSNRISKPCVSTPFDLVLPHPAPSCPVSAPFRRRSVPATSKSSSASATSSTLVRPPPRPPPPPLPLCPALLCASCALDNLRMQHRSLLRGCRVFHTPVARLLQGFRALFHAAFTTF